MADDDTTADGGSIRSDSSRDTEIIKALTRVGLLLYAAWALWLFQVMYRVTQVAGGVSAGLWEQRVENLAFIGFLPNLPALGLVAIVASIATWMAGPTQQLELAILLRLTRWTANGLAGIAVVNVAFAVFGVSGGIDEVGTIAFRAAGGVGAYGISTLCRLAGRNAPGG
jgi:hypothetical protein